ncbi:MAG: hypothetical protein JSR21_21320, partial [Proteobacteria bacterium]|nr:hypothetical protein [Pseudomonadota bacterium]
MAPSGGCVLFSFSMNPAPSSTPSRRSPTRTRSTGGSARTASGGAASGQRASGLTELGIVPLLLVIVSLGMRVLANPRMRAEDRASAQRAICSLLGLCLRIAFRQGLPAGRALLAVLRGTVLERKGLLLRKVAAGGASPEALPALDAPEAGRIAGALDRYLRRTFRIGATRTAANARRIAASA